MGMTIEDYIKIIKNWLYKGTNGLTNTKLGYMEGWFHKTDKEAFEVAIDIMFKYQQLQSDYENRLKADLVAMLDELDLELYEQYEDTDLVKVKYIRQSIQEKIDKLKGERNED